MTYNDEIIDECQKAFDRFRADTDLMWVAKSDKTKRLLENLEMYAACVVSQIKLAMMLGVDAGDIWGSVEPYCLLAKGTNESLKDRGCFQFSSTWDTLIDSLEAAINKGVCN